MSSRPWRGCSAKRLRADQAALAIPGAGRLASQASTPAPAARDRSSATPGRTAAPPDPIINAMKAIFTPRSVSARRGAD
jgi:hypothetical protein